jgi:hypothetical protein
MLRRQTLRDIVKQFHSSIVKVNRTKVITIRPSGMLLRGRIADAVRMQIQRIGSYVQPRKSNVHTI